MKKREDPMKDPNWIQKKRQEFVALKNAITRFEWGASYLPEACHMELYHIRRSIDRMIEPMTIWEPKK